MSASEAVPLEMSSWDAALIAMNPSASLVEIARERRLVLDDGKGARRVDLCWVDEVALSLIDLATSKGRDLTIVYPAPAGQVAVLIAARLLVRQFVQGNRRSSIGIVTADPTMATRTWDALQVATTGDRVPLADVFPAYRAGPHGESPVGGRRLQGAVIGHSCQGWPVDHLVVDRLAGPVRVDTHQVSIEVVSDPIDPALRRAEEDGRSIWGWSEGTLARGQGLEHRVGHTVPFSVAAERLDTIAHGIEVRLGIAHHSEAERAAARAREDLHLMRVMAPERGDRNLERGLALAWHHLTTLTSLPCRPSRFDRFCGYPPRAARSTATFAEELSAWSATLPGEFAEIGAILASDIADLRAALELGNPFEEMLRGELVDAGRQTLVVLRTHTAARALLDLLGLSDDADGADAPTVRSVRQLHRQGTRPHVVHVGEPSPWDWHRLLSGLAPVVDVFALGTRSAGGCARLVESVRSASDHWGSHGTRARTWRAIVGSAPPPTPTDSTARRRPPVVVIDGVEYTPEPDPFESLSSLLDLDPFELGGEGPSSGLARMERDAWIGAVPAVRVTTDRGPLLLEIERPVDVREGSRIVERRPETLEPGAILLVGHREGRVGLIEALEEQLRDRPDLLATRFLLDDYRRRVRKRWSECGATVAELHGVLRALGCDKTSHAVRSWITDTVMAPRHFSDLERLNTALELGMSPTLQQELFAAVQHRRGFRRATGRALAKAARGATLVEENRADPQTGLSIADLRDAVIQAVVVRIDPCRDPVPLALIGRLESR